MRLAAAVLTSALLGGCVDRRVIDVPIDAYAFEYGFMVLLNGDGRATEVSQPFGVNDGAVTFGALPAFRLDEEERLLLVALPAGALRAAVPVFDEGRAAALELTPNGPTELPYYESDPLEGEFLSVALPDATQVLGAELDEELAELSMPEGFALRVPIAPEQCSRVGSEGLVPFAATEEVIAPNPVEEYDNFFFVDLIAEDVAVTMTPKNLFLIHADVPYEPTPVTMGVAGTQLGREAMPAARYTLSGYAFDREAGRVWLSGFADGVGQVNGMVFELAVDRDAITIVDMLTIGTEPLAAITLDAARRPVVLSLSGNWFTVENRAFTAMSPPIEVAFPEELVYRLVYTGDASLPYVASTTGKLHVFDTRLGAWVTEEISSSLLPTFPEETHYVANALTSARTADGELELWAGGTSTLVFHKVGDGPWRQVDFVFPPRFAGCSANSASYPNLNSSGGFDTIRIVGDDMFVTIRECTSALQVRRDGSYIALLPVEGAPPVFTMSDLQAIDVLGNVVVVAGENGRLYRGLVR